jgi:hypothetical protein
MSDSPTLLRRSRLWRRDRGDDPAAQVPSLLPLPLLPVAVPSPSQLISQLLLDGKSAEDAVANATAGAAAALGMPVTEVAVQAALRLAEYVLADVLISPVDFFGLMWHNFACCLTDPDVIVLCCQVGAAIDRAEWATWVAAQPQRQYLPTYGTSPAKLSAAPRGTHSAEQIAEMPAAQARAAGRKRVNDPPKGDMLAAQLHGLDVVLVLWDYLLVPIGASEAVAAHIVQRYWRRANERYEEEVPPGSVLRQATQQWWQPRMGPGSPLAAEIRRVQAYLMPARAAPDWCFTFPVPPAMARMPLPDVVRAAFDDLPDATNKTYAIVCGIGALSRVRQHLTTYASGRATVSMGCAAARGGHHDVLELLVAHLLPAVDKLCEAAAQGGRSDTLAYLMGKGCTLSERVAACAARHGQLATLRWLREEKGCAWTSAAMLAGVDSGDAATVEYLLQRGCPMHPDVATHAAASRSTAVVDAVHAAGVALSNDMCATAAKHGDVSMLQHLRSKGCPWDDTTLMAAALANQVPCLRLAVHGGLQLTTDVLMAALRGKSADAVAYLVPLCGPPSPTLLEEAAAAGNLRIFQAVYEHALGATAIATTPATSQGVSVPSAALAGLEAQANDATRPCSATDNAGGSTTAAPAGGPTPPTGDGSNGLRAVPPPTAGPCTSAVADAAAGAGARDILRYLRARGHAMGYSTTAAAARLDDDATLAWLHKHHVPWDATCATAAAEAASRECLHYLLQHDCAVDNSTWRALIAGRRRAHRKCIELMEEAGCQRPTDAELAAGAAQPPATPPTAATGEGMTTNVDTSHAATAAEGAVGEAAAPATDAADRGYETASTVDNDTAEDSSEHSDTSGESGEGEQAEDEGTDGSSGNKKPKFTCAACEHEWHTKQWRRRPAFM